MRSLSIQLPNGETVSEPLETWLLALVLSLPEQQLRRVVETVRKVKYGVPLIGTAPRIVSSPMISRDGIETDGRNVTVHAPPLVVKG